MRLVLIEESAMWTGNTQFQTILHIPDDMDLDQHEQTWFAQGGGDTEGFVAYLKTQGAKEHEDIEYFELNFM